MRILAERKCRCRVAKIVLHALKILSGIQHTDSKGVTHIMKSVLFDPAFFKSPLVVLIHGSSDQVLSGFIREHQIPFVLPSVPKSRFVTQLLLLFFPKRIHDDLRRSNQANLIVLWCFKKVVTVNALELLSDLNDQ